MENISGKYDVHLGQLSRKSEKLINYLKLKNKNKISETYIERLHLESIHNNVTLVDLTAYRSY
jgi:predicted NUDIX family phosphoesterase